MHKLAAANNDKSRKEDSSKYRRGGNGTKDLSNVASHNGRLNEIIEVEDSFVHVYSTASMKKRMEKSLITEAVDLSHMRNIGSFPDAEGFLDVKIKYLGGMFILLYFLDSKGPKGVLDNEFPWKN
ncbi:hypothetical protein L6452_02874 [Arctium lappa]|uniref:Uncharacterized protein n=1 Tax=Arctium lappa TaxID=4217 RepID=A0ACB9FKM2_ARCLA|nr:hypothetical protein L6452_02874 [Arctium lappa]